MSEGLTFALLELRSYKCSTVRMLALLLLLLAVYVNMSSVDVVCWVGLGVWMGLSVLKSMDVRMFALSTCECVAFRESCPHTR